LKHLLPDGVPPYCQYSVRNLLNNTLTYSALPFPVRLKHPPDIKKRIENLIEREFLERDPNDRKMYRYLA
jgi:hypothetical protein